MTCLTRVFSQSPSGEIKGTEAGPGAAVRNFDTELDFTKRSSLDELLPADDYGDDWVRYSRMEGDGDEIDRASDSAVT